MKHLLTFLLITTALTSPATYAQQVCNKHILPDTLTERFQDNNDGSVTDKVTGLIWKRCSVGQSWNPTDANCEGAAAAYDWQAALATAKNTGDSWRLPNSKELSSIMERRCYTPAINLNVFPSTASTIYWSSSPHANVNGLAWGVDFNHGYAYFDAKDTSGHVRLVRSGK